jgi:hypothetical protein
MDCGGGDCRENDGCEYRCEYALAPTPRLNHRIRDVFDAVPGRHFLFHVDLPKVGVRSF